MAFRPTARSRALARDPRSRGLTEGYRSGLEERISAQLTTRKVPFKYEEITVEYEQPAKKRRYKPDFVLLHNGIVVETKGRFQTADRQKHLMVQAQHPDLDIRFLFSNSKARISKQSKTTYALWCESNGFAYADKEIPFEWLNEPPNYKSLEIIKRLLEKKK